MNEKYTASDDAYNAIKEMILNGYLTPGEKINQDEVAERLGLSRMPVRRALDMLSQDRLVTVIPHRGAYVSKLDAKSLNDIYDARAQLESMAMILAVRNATDKDIATLYHMVETQKVIRQTNKTDFAMRTNENKLFHRFITSLSGNDYYLMMFDNLWDRSEIFRRIYHRRAAAVPTPDHEIIVNLMEQRKPQAAADFTIKHIRKTQKRLLVSMGENIDPLVFKPIYIGNSHDYDYD